MVDKQASILQSIQTRTTTRLLVDPGFDNVPFYVNEQKIKKNKANTNTNRNKKQKLSTDLWLGKKSKIYIQSKRKENFQKVPIKEVIFSWVTRRKHY